MCDNLGTGDRLVDYLLSAAIIARIVRTAGLFELLVRQCPAHQPVMIDKCLSDSLGKVLQCSLKKRTRMVSC